MFQAHLWYGFPSGTSKRGQRASTSFGRRPLRPCWKVKQSKKGTSLLDAATLYALLPPETQSRRSNPVESPKGAGFVVRWSQRNSSEALSAGSVCFCTCFPTCRSNGKQQQRTPPDVQLSNNKPLVQGLVGSPGGISDLLWGLMGFRSFLGFYVLLSEFDGMQFARFLRIFTELRAGDCSGRTSRLIGRCRTLRELGEA